MTEWYYTRDGKQIGPVSFERLLAIAAGGELDRSKDLVWNPSMKDWALAGTVTELFPPMVPAPDSSNPYAAPVSSLSPAAQITMGEAMDEIVPGSEPFDVMACVKRGFDLTVRHFGIILLVGIIYFAVTFGVGLVVGLVDHALGYGTVGQTNYQMNFGLGYSTAQHNGSIAGILIKQLISVFLSLGLARIGLNLVSGREISVGMLFGGGRKFLPAVGATFVYMLMVSVGMLLLIVPGIYLAVRYGQYLTAMVDRDLGVIDSFAYSSKITTNNRINLFLLGLMAILVSLAGCLVLYVGLLFAMPVVMPSWMVAYRWMQYGNRAALDHPGTTSPMLGNIR